MKIYMIAATMFACTQVSASPAGMISRDLPRMVQPVPSPHYFTFFRLHKQNKGVGVMWGMNATRGVSRYDIEATYEDPNDPYSNWTVKGSVFLGRSAMLKFLDRTDMWPGIVNYRIVAYTDAGPVASDYESITIN